MGRYASARLLVLTVLVCIFHFACGTNRPTQVVKIAVPASVSLAPSGNVSIELGKTQVFIPSAKNGAGSNIAETFSFESSNPAILTVANNGVACAGTWDSLVSPLICTAGATGTAQVTAVAQGVSSPPVTVYVHQHITGIVVRKAPNQPPTLSSQCLSKGGPNGSESVIYQAFAFNNSTDITSSVGPFSWTSINSTGQVASPVSLSSPGVTAPLNEQVATAAAPGATNIVASSTGVNSQPVQFMTCPVQTISIAATGNPSTSFIVNSGTSVTLDATVTDILGRTLTGVPLTWSSSDPKEISVPANGTSSTVFGSTATVSASAAGAGSVTASCTPPICNGGITPSMPIYPTQAISFEVRSTTSPLSPTVYVSTTACNQTTQACTTRVVPITKAGTNGTFAAGAPLPLPFAPNSLLFDRQGTNAYFGVESSGLGVKGLMIVNGSSATPATIAAGKVLAISPDGSLTITSDTVDSPNRVFICQNCGSSNRTAATFVLPGATAASFSADNVTGGFKAFVVSGSSCPGTASSGCLLVYSKVDAAKIIPLSAPATDVAFIGNGTLGYIGGGTGAGAANLPLCEDPAVSGSIVPVSVPGQFLRQLPDGQSVLALSAGGASAPDVHVVSTGIAGSPSVGVPGCPQPRGFLTITNSVSGPFGLGAGPFTPNQFFVSPDGSAAYILGTTATGPLPFIIRFDLATQLPTFISLNGNAVPLSASVSPAGDLLFVGADDGTIHVINVSTELDIQQVQLPFPQDALCIGPGTPATQVALSLASISAAAQNGSATTYSYSLGAGPALQVGQTIVIAGMTDSGNNGTFTIASLGAGTFTVSNASGVNASNQNGTGTVPLACNPDLVAVKP